MKAKCFLTMLIILNINFIVFSQEEIDVYQFSNDRIVWEGKIYLCNISPLSSFKGYKQLYKEDNILSCIRDLLGSPIRDEKEYEAKWYIRDSVLYLYDVYYICDYDSIFPNQYSKLEELTGSKFQAVNDSINCVKLRNGSLRADWFTGQLIVKYYPEDFFSDSDYWYKYTWETTPFTHLKFLNGKLVKIKEVNLSKLKY
jgi:hypothetical protein